MDFDWDPKKAAANLAKHAVDFRDAIGIFERPTIEWIDRRFEYGEERWIAIGRIQETELVVVYVKKDEERRRIISARRANSKERQVYWRQVQD